MNLFAAVIARKAIAGGGGGGPIFVNDSFTDTNGTDLTAHTGETGATWAKATGYTGPIKIHTNRAKGDSGPRTIYYASGTPDTNEYDVEADIFIISSNDYPGIGGRVDPVADDGYYVRLDFDAVTWNLYERVAAVDTLLGQYSPGTMSIGSTHSLKLEIRTAAKKFYFDGVERISSANNNVTATGKTGIQIINSDSGFGTTGRALVNFVATNA